MNKSEKVDWADWTDRLGEVDKLTQHNIRFTKVKSSLIGLTGSTHFVSKLTGLREDRSGDSLVLHGHNFTTNPTPALVDVIGGVGSLPRFTSTFLPEIVHREDYSEAVELASDNLSKFETALKHDKQAKALFVPYGKFDPRREDKKLLCDVYKALQLSLVNQIKGHQLGLTKGNYVYIRVKDLMQLLERPQAATERKVYNAVVYLRITGALRLAKEEELAEEGKGYLHLNVNGRLLASYSLFKIERFENVNWRQLTDNYELNLNVHPSHEQIVQVVGETYARDFFPDITAGATKSEYDMMKALHNSRGSSNKPIVSLRTLSQTVQALEDSSQKTAVRHIDQLLVSSQLEMEKLTIKDAESYGYDLDGYNNSAKQGKVIVSNSREALLQCREKLVADIEQMKRVNALLKHKAR
jgi:hypothetical protein